MAMKTESGLAMTDRQWKKFKKQFPEAPDFLQSRNLDDAVKLIELRRKAFPATAQ